MIDKEALVIDLLKQHLPEIKVGVIIKLVDCLEKCLIYGHIRRFAD